MKINFKNYVVPINFEGQTASVDLTKTIGNAMMFNGSILLDIGFEDLAKEIYYSEGEVEIPEQYKAAMTKIVQEQPFIATVKRQLINDLK